jgi:hypothetical protein
MTTNSVYCLPPYNTVPATMETLAFLLSVTMQRNNTGVMSVSIELFDYGCLVTTAFSQTRHITILYYTIVYYTILFLCSVLRLLVTANVVPSSHSCHPDDESDKFIRNVGATRRNIIEDGIRHSHCRENCKSYICDVLSSPECSPKSGHKSSKPHLKMCHSSNLGTTVKQTNSVAFSLQANFTDWATATGRRN